MRIKEWKNITNQKNNKMETKIRTLRAEEIECRVQSVTPKGCILLIYKDARVDMKILDEVYGNNNWQRTHEVINENLFCNIDIWDNEKKSWVRKQDVGTESNTEKEKGQASDSFKRAGFNVGIGRELYTAPFIWVNLQPEEITKFSGKEQLVKGVNFLVKEIEYNEQREISKLVIVDKKGVVRFPSGKVVTPKDTNPVTPKTSTPTPTPPTFDKDKIAKELGMCKSVKEMTKHWNDNVALHPNEEYITLIKMRRKQIETK